MLQRGLSLEVHWFWQEMDRKNLSDPVNSDSVKEYFVWRRREAKVKTRKGHFGTSISKKKREKRKKRKREKIKRKKKKNGEAKVKTRKGRLETKGVLSWKPERAAQIWKAMQWPCYTGFDKKWSMLHIEASTNYFGSFKHMLNSRKSS